MTTGADSTKVIFVPGIMGSGLRYRGPGEWGQPVDEEVWGGDLRSNIDLLSTNPSRLASEYVEAVQVLDEIRVLPYFSINIYGTLLDSCTHAGGLSIVTSSEFHPFPYDWRKDNRVSAEELGAFIADIDPEGVCKLRIIGHSMGGIVARLMLLANPAIAVRTEVFYQIAAPTEGSAKAYYTLRERPVFDGVFDAIWTLFHHLRPTTRAKLQSTMQGFASIYQLMPPSRIKTLINRTGQQFAAVEKEAWPQYLHQFVEAAMEVHAILERPIASNIKCFYSNSKETDIIYLVDSCFNIIAAKTRAEGDGTVACSSAFASTGVMDRHLVPGTNHNNICSHPVVLNLVKSAFV